MSYVLVVSSCIYGWLFVALVLLVLGCSGSLFLSSSFVILSTSSATTSSRWVIQFAWELLTSFWSRMSCWSWVIALSCSFYRAHKALFLSSWSSLTRVYVFCISITFFSRLLPAVWTVRIWLSASFFQHLSALSCSTRLLMYAAQVLRLRTRSEKN